MKKLLILPLLAAISTLAYAAPRKGPTFSINDAAVTEGSSATFTITKSGSSTQSSIVSYSTRSGTATTADYVTTSGTLTFAPSETRKTVTVKAIEDTLAESAETFTVRLRADSNARLTRTAGTGTIRDNASFPVPEPTPVPTATPAPVDSNVDIPSNLESIPVAGTAAPDVVGAFRFQCAASHLAYDDPIIMPGQPGQFHHLHQFFGNTLTNANSTFESLRATGQSTCVNDLNRSAYWAPALLGRNAQGVQHVVVPTYINIYYKRLPYNSSELVDPARSRNWTTRNLPPGLRYVFGYPLYQPKFRCILNGDDLTGYGPSMDIALANCPVGGEFIAAADSPPCWDGVSLDSADHRTHVRNHYTNSWEGFLRCPDGYNKVIATFTVQIAYKIIAGDNTATWAFSSDAHMTPGQPRGTSFHSDWFGAWEPSILDTWQANCIDLLLTCASGNLGNGTIMKPSAFFTAKMALPPQRLPLP